MTMGVHIGEEASLTTGEHIIPVYQVKILALLCLDLYGWFELSQLSCLGSSVVEQHAWSVQCRGGHVSLRSVQIPLRAFSLKLAVCLECLYLPCLVYMYMYIVPAASYQGRVQFQLRGERERTQSAPLPGSN